MSNQKVDDRDIEQLLDEHRQLRVILDEIRSALAEQQDDTAILAKLFGNFADHVRCHFDQEEAGGYFADVVAAAPRLSDRVQFLLAQHAEFCETIDGLCHWAKSGDGSDVWWTELTTRFEHFAQQFVRHEHAENTMVQEAYECDIGDKD